MRRRLGRVEQRVAGPYIVDVIDAQIRVLEQMGGLGVDLEGVLVVEEVGIQPPVTHTRHCNTNEYATSRLRGLGDDDTPSRGGFGSGAKARGFDSCRAHERTRGSTSGLPPGPRRHVATSDLARGSRLEGLVEEVDELTIEILWRLEIRKVTDSWKRDRPR